MKYICDMKILSNDVKIIHQRATGKINITNIQICLDKTKTWRKGIELYIAASFPSTFSFFLCVIGLRTITHAQDSFVLGSYSPFLYFCSKYSLCSRKSKQQNQKQFTVCRRKKTVKSAVGKKQMSLQGFALFMEKHCFVKNLIFKNCY